jgi:virginiamycin A acetyltransferase
VPYASKRLIVGALCLLTWPLSLPALFAYRLFGRESLFDFSAKLLSLVPGLIGQYLRTSFYVVTLARCPADLAMAFGSFFSRPSAQVGRAVVVGSFSIIGDAVLGEGVLIASRASVLSGKHQHAVGSDGAVAHGSRYEVIHVGPGCWIGEGAIVMASLGERCVVSAGSVVTKPAPPRIVAVGNPARFLRGQEAQREG